MEPVYTWKIESLEIENALGGAKDVVIKAHWRIIGTYADLWTDIFGVEPIVLPDATNFIPFQDLTEAQVLDWVKTSMGPDQVAELMVIISRQLNALREPQTSIIYPQWEANSSFSA